MVGSSSRALLAGYLIGPIFLIIWAAQALTRDGYRPGYHPLSLLSLGDLGWVQITNFVVAGGLHLILATGLHRAWRGTLGGTWIPRLIAASGVGLIIAGVFVTDPGGGFPPGTPDGPPPAMSWHGGLHEVGFVITMVAGLASYVLLVRRWWVQGRRSWMIIGIVLPLASLVIAGWPDLSSLGPRLVAGTAVQFLYLAVIAASARRDSTPAADPTGTTGVQTVKEQTG